MKSETNWNDICKFESLIKLKDYTDIKEPIYKSITEELYEMTLYFKKELSSLIPNISTVSISSDTILCLIKMHHFGELKKVLELS